MWQDFKEKLIALRHMDKQCQAFAADEHRYQFGDLVTPALLEHVEKKLNLTLPEQLRQFYLTVGNGGAGPYYGLQKIEALYDYEAAKPYPGAEALMALRKRDDEDPLDESLSLDREDLSGLMPILFEGCGHEVCLITSGEKTGKIAWFSIEHGISEPDVYMLDLFTNWVDRQLEIFNAIRTLADSDYSLEDIGKQMVEKYHEYDAASLVMSVLNIQKPESLFGTKNRKTYHHAIQFPWYEEQLAHYRQNPGPGIDRP
ncbi:SMI1/KNR4 family protein [Undibacterium pigrum]|uniref:SMI1/KNR4 family protein SUKH-1 n=1 Tax=Undibacterium pigrum TaxID=401470 RepID=A0A318JCE6_9BURK|nr:SMI1/KNR4 family protein [Undibacterium pigrum]PXX41498.1 SMI1/KNR4 family protein SUKH-1 [Undibacterium pigrum]